MSATVPDTRPFAGFYFLPVRAPVVRRVVQLLVGLSLFGVGMAWTLEAALGASPWTVFHEGVSEQIALSLGTIVSLTGVCILGILWLLKEPLGLGTLMNVAVIGPVADLTLWVVPDLESLPVRLVLLGLAPVTIGLGSGLYLGAGVGPGPRDGVMTALSRRGIATWKARTAVEVTALVIGILLGGTAGLGTIWMAVAIGPCVQFFLPWFTIDQT